MTDATRSEMWRQLLTGDQKMLQRNRRFWGMLPRDPRCKLCAAPFAGLGSRLARMRKRGRNPSNPSFCGLCNLFAETMPGGADIELTLALADVRGSTEMAATMPPSEFAAEMGRFYELATTLLHRGDAFIDKLVGDEVIGLYVPAFSGDRHTCLAIEAWRELLRRTRPSGDGPTLPVGAAVHFGEAYVGTVGAGEQHTTDFTAMGATMNLAARLASAAGEWELLVTRPALEVCEDGVPVAEWRTLELRGIPEPVEVAVVG